ncbi:MAG: ribonuclease HIII [Nanoarchaeota archaeon]|nr:ribonuclease HIII [Nanoarchaeota archaeon]
MTTYTKVQKKELRQLLDFGYIVEKTKTEYEVIRLRGNGAVMILFTSNKLLVQGKEESVKAVEALFSELKIGKKVIPIKFAKEEGVVIGSDESLKGDSFGGIVVAAVKANDDQRRDLLFAGVMDSKKLDDNEIFIIAQRVKKVVEYKVISMMPEEYNKYDGVTEILNKLHNQVITELRPCDMAITDKYPGCKVKAKMETKAESKYVEVAAASILAREAAIKQLQKLSKRIGFELPKGSTHVAEALKKAASKVNLKTVAKLHFKNVQKFLL